MSRFNKLYNLILLSIQEYLPPYNEQQMRLNGYSLEIILKLKRDPVHSWRMLTGLELIHRLPTKTLLERIWKNWQRMTDDLKIVSDDKCLELFGKTNLLLYNYLISQYKVDRPGKDEIKYPSIPLNEEVLKNIKNGKVYHARSKFRLKLMGSRTRTEGENGSVFVTPFKGIASCFIIDHQQILDEFLKKLGKRITSCNFNYDVWDMPNNWLENLVDTVNVTIETNQIKSDIVLNGIATGYLYTIDFEKYKDKCHMFNKQPNSDVEFCILGDVDYLKVLKISVKWTCKIGRSRK